MTKLDDFDPDAIADHIREAVRMSPLLDDPFPHVVIERILPTDFFNTLVRAVPAEEFFVGKDRRRLDFEPGIAPSSPALTKAVWSVMETTLVDGVLKAALAARFREQLRKELTSVLGPELVEDALALPLESRNGRIMLRRSGWRLEPHLDPKRQFITTLLYLAKPGEPEAYGTRLYRVEGRAEASYSNTYYPAVDGLRCEIAKTVPFRSNLLLSFLNLGGVHGAGIPEEAGPDLTRIAYQFYIGPQDAALDALIARLPENRRTPWIRVVKKKERLRLIAEAAAHPAAD